MLGRPVEPEGRAHRAFRLRRRKLLRRDVSGISQPLHLALQGGDCFLQPVWRRLPGDGNGPHLIECVVIHADELKQPGVDEAPLQLRSGLVERIRENVGGVRCRRILADTRPLPLQHDGDGAHGTLHHHRSAGCQRRYRRNGFCGKRILALRPVAQEPLGQGEDGVGIHVAGDDERGVVRNVVAPLDVEELRGSHPLEHVALADDVLAAPLAWIQRLSHLLLELEERARLVPIVFAEDHLPFPFELLAQEPRTAQCSRHEPDAPRQAVGG